MGKRRAGILLHPTSLPGPFGVGDLGPAADRFLAWLATAGVSVWQTLPLNVTGLGGSPYTPASAFAGNPTLLSPERLRDDGLVTEGELATAPGGEAGRVHLDGVESWKRGLLRAAWERFRRQPSDGRLAQEMATFETHPEQAPWLDDWALFAALKSHLGGSSWLDWPPELRDRRPEALRAARAELAGELAYRRFVQFLFFRQWAAVRAGAEARGVEILGDLPIYVALDSADVWAHRDLFDLDERGRPRTVAGVPPDYFSETGQRWGNPIYRWGRIRDSGYAWWIDRMRANFRLAHRVRIDHFRGLVAFWRVPADEETAVRGEWSPGPGIELFDALADALGELALVAEDLGEITPDVEELRVELGLPGMRVLQFGFDAGSPHAPHRLTADTVVYTGTHDNDTTRGWLATADAATRARALDYLDATPDTIHRALLRAAWVAPSELAVAPLQDVLGLGPEARMNTPGEPAGNWSWRLADEAALDEGRAARLRRLTEVAERLPPESVEDPGGPEGSPGAG